MKGFIGFRQVVLVFVCLSMLSAAACLAQGVPTAITYQGKLTDPAGNPVPDGSYNMQFALYDVETGGSPLWTSSTMSVPCAGGFFTARIEVTKPGNVPLGDVWIEPTVGTTALPRVKLASVPYALYAQELVLPFAGSASTSDEVLRISNTGTGMAGFFRNSSTANDMPALFARHEGTGSAMHALSFSTTSGSAGRFETMSVTNTAPALLGMSRSSGNAVQGQNTGTGHAGFFNIFNSSSAASALYCSTDGTGPALQSETTGTGRAGYFNISNTGNSQDAVYATTSGTGNAIRAVVTNLEATPGRFEISSSTNYRNAVHATTTGSGRAVYGYTTGGGRAAHFEIDNASNSSAALRAQTNGTGYAGEFVRTSSSTQAVLYSSAASVGPAVHGYQTGLGHGGFFEIANAGSGSAAVRGETIGSGSHGLYGRHNPTGNFGHVGSSGFGVYGHVNAEEARGVQGSASGFAGIALYGYASGANSAGLHAVSTGSGGIGIYCAADVTNGVGIRARGGASGLAAMFEGNVRLLDRDTYAVIMELGKGLDYAEGFDVSNGVDAEPGTVLVIDTANPGKLTVSTKAYDSRVAGIVAGANGLSSGVRLGVDQFDCDVALAGRVYCNVDATEAGVEPGDLLTTSGTPGYAMKVTRRQNANGAILGKAMEALPEGTKGQILVLVTLQ